MARAPGRIPAFHGDAQLDKPKRKKPTRPTTLMIATLETSRFTFEGVGTNDKEAKSALESALKKHGQEYQLPMLWYRKDYGFPDNIEYRAVTAGAGYRDEDMIAEPKGTS